VRAPFEFLHTTVLNVCILPTDLERATLDLRGPTKQLSKIILDPYRIAPSSNWSRSRRNILTNITAGEAMSPDEGVSFPFFPVPLSLTHRHTHLLQTCLNVPIRQVSLHCRCVVYVIFAAIAPFSSALPLKSKPRLPENYCLRCRAQDSLTVLTAMNPQTSHSDERF